MLNCERDTRTMEIRIRKAARAAKLGKRLVPVFEHGQWWVTDLRTGAQWSAIDAEGPGSTEGFFFEQVTEGEEE